MERFKSVRRDLHLKKNRKFALGLLALIILCACARAPQEIVEKSLVPAEPSKSEDVRNSIVRVVSRSQIRGVGNGFFVAPDKIATNIHLIADANPVSVHVRGRGGVGSIRGVTAYDLKNNLVILKVSIKGTPLRLGDSNTVKISDTISDAGLFARGSKDKAKQGTILGIRDNDKWFPTTLQPEPDVSGGPILNSENEVVGIEVIEREFGYAVPSNALKVLLTQSDPVESVKQWQQRDGIRAYSYVEKAKRKFRDDDYSAMIEVLNEAITLNPEFATAYTKRSEGKLHLGAFEAEKGNATEAQRHYRSAIDDSDKALQLNPEFAAAYKNRGLAKRLLADSEANAGKAVAQRHYHAAIADYTQAIKQVPNNATSYTDRGTARKNFGQFESGKGNVAAAEQHYRTAIADYTQAIKLKPDHAKAYHGRGLTKEILGHHKEAKADLEKAETLKREQATVRMGGRDNHATGFFVTRNKVATNVHVIAHREFVLVRSVDDEKNWTVEGVTAFDAKNDLAILKVTEEGTPLPLGDSDTLQRGETVSAVGYPKGKYTVAEGTLHSVRDSDKWLQMNVKISPGNSGSPVINSKGQVIGIVSASEDPYSYAVPSNALKALLTQSGSAEPLALWRKRVPIHPYVYASRGTRNYFEGRYDEAIADFNKVIELNPENTHAYYNRGLAKFRLGDIESEKGNTEKARQLYEAGIADSTQAIKRTPEDANAYHNRAGGKFRLAQLETAIPKVQQYYQDAIDDWTQVITLNPELSDPYSNRGAAKALLGESKADQGDIAEVQALYASAIQDCTHAIQLNPENPDPYINRGYAQFRLGKTQADQGDTAGAEALYITAIRDCTQAIQLNPEKDAAYSNRGVAKAALGNPEGAIEDLDAAIRLNPKEAEYFHERGLAKEALGQTEAAKADFQKAKKLDPDVDK